MSVQFKEIMGFCFFAEKMQERNLDEIFECPLLSGRATYGTPGPKDSLSFYLRSQTTDAYQFFFHFPFFFFLNYFLEKNSVLINEISVVFQF
jgi:hypothetical protein